MVPPLLGYSEQAGTSYQFNYMDCMGGDKRLTTGTVVGHRAMNLWHSSLLGGTWAKRGRLHKGL